MVGRGRRDGVEEEGAKAEAVESAHQRGGGGVAERGWGARVRRRCFNH